MINSLQYYESTSHDPYVNLAVERYLTDNAKAGIGIMFLWQNDNTVVIGKNQNPYAECDVDKIKQDNVKIARRTTGGGAVFHDLGNLNFSFINVRSEYNVDTNLSVIINALSRLGIKAEKTGRNDIEARLSGILSGIANKTAKFSGNAFYESGRYDEAPCLHHGTILINADMTRLAGYLKVPDAKLESHGVKSVKSRVVNLSEINNEITTDLVKKELFKAYEERYGLKCDKINIDDLYNNPDVIKYRDELKSDKWIFEKNIKFTHKMEISPTTTLYMLVEGDTIKKVSYNTDDLDPIRAEEVERNLIGQKYDTGLIWEVMTYGRIL